MSVGREVSLVRLPCDETSLSNCGAGRVRADLPGDGDAVLPNFRSLPANPR